MIGGEIIKARELADSLALIQIRLDAQNGNKIHQNQLKLVQQLVMFKYYFLKYLSIVCSWKEDGGCIDVT